MHTQPTQPHLEQCHGHIYDLIVQPIAITQASQLLARERYGGLLMVGELLIQAPMALAKDEVPAGQLLGRVAASGALLDAAGMVPLSTHYVQRPYKPYAFSEVEGHQISSMSSFLELAKTAENRTSTPCFLSPLLQSTLTAQVPPSPAPHPPLHRLPGRHPLHLPPPLLLPPVSVCDSSRWKCEQGCWA
eukprot:552369-Pelagomonas_calceolata.AAC.1